jgi:hypothetical protein
MAGSVNSSVSGGTAAMVVVILAWLLGLAHLSVPPDVQAAFQGLITAGAGFVIHWQSKRTAAATNAQPVPPAQVTAALVQPAPVSVQPLEGHAP